ncbi:HTH domain-containing protein [Halostagnicola larsenii]|nr:HTH domain-containing protein [Halostagnicola larsenii]
MADSVAISAAIQARYGAFATYRQLFETRKKKRASALTPEVDAADPFGTLIDSFVIRGLYLHRFEEYLRDARESPVDVHEDAPEISIRILVVDTDRRTPYSTAVQRMCEAKNLDPTREAVSFLQAFTASPYAVTRALQQLGHESTPQEMHLDEVRYALATLPANRIFPNAPPTVSKAVHALLATSRPLTQAELAEQAGISARLVRNHVDHLEALWLIEVTVDGYRLPLPFREERGPAGDAHLSWYLTPNHDRDDYLDATERGVLFEAVIEREGVSDDDVIRVFDRIKTLQIMPEARREIEAVGPTATPLLEAVRVLAAEEPDREFTDTVIVGVEPEQAALPARLATTRQTGGTNV